MALIPGYEDGFNAEQVSPAGAFEPIPKGKYAAMIVASEVKDTKKLDGQYLSLRFKIIEGEYENRQVFANLNMVNKSEVAQQLARQQFSAICHATGVLNPTNTTELHGIPMLITVKVREGTDNYPPANDITRFEALDAGDTEDAPW